MTMEKYFEKFRKEIIGNDCVIETPFGRKKVLYADWTASGRLYRKIENYLLNEIGPLYGNTHAEYSTLGKFMTNMYEEAKRDIKKHVNANSEDVLLFSGTGMTGAIDKLLGVTGLKYLKYYKYNNECERPVVFITHMEHSSNYLPWLELNFEVVILTPENGEVSLNVLEDNLKKYKNKNIKIGSFTACSNVTGMRTNYHKMAALMHKYGGVCFVDFAASAPYIDINMHPGKEEERLDGIYFSPHKFLGGPGASGVLVFNSKLYSSVAPDRPGGGTVEYLSPFGPKLYIENIEQKEDGGTPGIIQGIKSSLALKLKDKMGVSNISKREVEINKLFFKEMENIKGISIIEEEKRDRGSIISMSFKNIHHNLMVKVLNDKYGIQSRSGCVCAHIYAHYLFNVGKVQSEEILCHIKSGDYSLKPGVLRLSFNPTTTDNEIYRCTESIKYIVKNINKIKEDYKYLKFDNEFINIHENNRMTYKVKRQIEL